MFFIHPLWSLCVVNLIVFIPKLCTSKIRLDFNPLPNSLSENCITVIKLKIYKDLQVFMHKIVQWSYELSEGTLLYYLIRDQGMFD